jgi:hypothetical protein
MSIAATRDRQHAKGARRTMAGVRFVEGHRVIDRRTFVMVGLFTALPTPALQAQQAHAPARIGFLRIVVPPRLYIEAFEQGLRDRG